MKYLIVIIASSFYAFGFNYHLTPHSITDNVDCFFGLTSTPDITNGGNTVNTCYVKTKDSYIVIDSGPSYNYAQQAYNAMQQKQKLPVKFLINTSTSETSILGNDFYKERGAILVGPAGFNKNLVPSMSKLISPDAFANTRVKALDKGIDKNINLSLGGTKVMIRKPFSKDNTNIYAYFPDQKVLFAGNLFYNNTSTPISANHPIQEWLQSIAKAELLPWERAISSHGVKTRRDTHHATKSYLSGLIGGDENPLASAMNVLPTSLNPLAKDDNRATKMMTASTLSSALSMAKASNRIVMVKVEANNCGFCEKLNSALISNATMKRLLGQYFVLLKINIDKEDLPAIKNAGEIEIAPTVIFVSPSGESMQRVEGFGSANEMISVMGSVIATSKNSKYIK